MAIHPTYAPPAQPPDTQAAQPLAYTPPTQAPPPIEQARVGRRRGEMALVAITLLVACAAAVMSGIALSRDQMVGPSDPQPASPSVQTPTSAEAAAAKNAACSAWDDASQAMVTARQPFLDLSKVGTQWSWSDPAVAQTLSQAQSGIMIQVEYLRQHVPSATPPELASAITDFNAANIDLAALDGQHQSAAVANAAADRTDKLATTIRGMCGS